MNNGYGGASYYNNGKIIPTQYFNNYSENINPMTINRVSPKEALYNALLKRQEEILAQEKARKVPDSNMPVGVLGYPAVNPLQDAMQYLYLLQSKFNR